MDVSSLSIEELILLSIEYISKGLNIPERIRDVVGPEIIADLEVARTHEYNKQTNIVD